MKKPSINLRAAVNIDRTNASRLCSLSEEFSLSNHCTASELTLTERDETEAEIVELVRSMVYQEILSECSFVSQENLTNIPRFSRNEVMEGLTLGKGGFGTINAVRGFMLNPTEERHDMNTSSVDFEEAVKGSKVESKRFIASHCFRENGGARYAVKRLQKKTLDERITCLNGMTDLANETLFLGSINHPHIIKLRGIAEEDICSKDFFIILDRLYDTLASRLVKWKSEAKRLSGLKRIFRKRGSHRSKDLLAERLNYASHLASALTYLHRLKIIHRDLKPENIGFDAKGDINMFDFGLARELPRTQRGSADNTFKLTMNAGTPRYMAPEVASGNYNEACDIYSASLLLWEFITLKRPFKDQKALEDFEKNVWCPNGARPKVPTKVSPGLQRLLTRSWSHNFNERPSAVAFENALRSEIFKLGNDEECSDEEMDSELYSSAPLRSTMKLRSNSKRLNKSLSWSLSGKGSLFDPLGTSVNTFVTNFDQSEVCQSFRSQC